MAESLDTSNVSDQNAEDSEVVTLTLNDVLELEDELIQDAAAVLGASNDKTCSYNDGYLKRQALYSCLTCIPEARNDPEKGAGICLACSYHCHDGHELVELYTKRNFRCDCGNKKFNGAKCNLCSEKEDYNELNKYNQNFGGIYCICHRPYPDSEDPLPDEMIQCIICEDWYHSRHLGVEIPSGPFAEMICGSCVGKHEFLLHYDTVEVTVSEEKQCKKPETKSENVGAKFWPDISWRNDLCTCDDCLEMYKKENVSFLIDSEDPVHLYEEKGKAKTKEVVETHNRNFMNSLDRVQLVEAIAGYNDLKENLAEYLKKFAENKKVVKEDDIREFFDGMMARKKQKVSVPHFCH
ncbi:putative E3 ubiquitin-protein ligase UBR7 [Tribolium castaneum]|uniref:E3 ubiquitin-protein ligase UBR7-like Protein n=1 Tax=Tribolium castaneum TaxID=7070 RepID=D2A237_TRICA|nr:PREDICTED: putative E3 ubiquitin-protein ligase UBR7 [Tribolium castaneum]EFA01491.1 Putative E3 ubiquitin-protein ligase UBR7-like Protein [Tribolium castaneum]|eukprot:XP_973657.1 PREDICTED: putative E3 ubiquitin-protein ligase UBR7 [Tribolium castaneum]